MDNKPEIKIASLLEKGLVVLTAVMAKPEIKLTKAEMIDFLNFETAVNFIVDAERKAEATRKAPISETVGESASQEHS